MLAISSKILNDWNPAQKRQALTKAFFQIVEKWKLTNEQKSQLLGWTYAHKRSVIDAMKRGDKAVDLDLDKLQRMIEVLHIHKNLRILFPHQRNFVYEWVHEKRERFGNFSAIDMMLTDGLLGMAAVRRYLDYVRTA